MSILSLFGQSSQYYYNYSNPYYNTNDATTGAAAVGFALFMLLFMFILAAAVYVVTGLTLSRIFKKAGIESWKGWVPVYNTWVLLELGGQQGFWAVLAFIPILNIASAIFIYIAMYHIGLNFGKSGSFVLLGIFLPLVWMIWLAVDSSTWKGQPVPVAQTNDQKASEEKDTIPPASPTE